MKLCAIAILILMISQSARAETTQAAEGPSDVNQKQTPRLTVDNISQKSEILRNPGLSVDNPKAALTSEKAAPKPSAPSLENSPEKIGDPTQMTGSFSQALSRIHGKPGPGVGGPAAAMPQIELTAKVYLQGSKAVMLKTGDKSHLIKESGKFSLLDKNMLYEIRVDHIERNGVTITVMPLGQKLILQ